MIGLSMKTGGRTIRCCIHVRGWIKQTEYPEGYRGILTDEDGHKLLPSEAREWFLDQLAQGRETIPTSSKCGNPCPTPGCLGGFNYSEDGGCPGFVKQPIETIAEVQS